MKKTPSAIQFCGSAMVNVWIGGMKKKLKHTTPKTEAKSAGLLPQRIAANSTTNKKVKATVVELMWPRNGLRKAVTAPVTRRAPQ